MCYTQCTIYAKCCLFICIIVISSFVSVLIVSVPILTFIIHQFLFPLSLAFISPLSMSY